MEELKLETDSSFDDLGAFVIGGADDSDVFRLPVLSPRSGSFADDDVTSTSGNSPFSDRSRASTATETHICTREVRKVEHITVREFAQLAVLQNRMDKTSRGNGNFVVMDGQLRFLYAAVGAFATVTVPDLIIESKDGHSVYLEPVNRAGWNFADELRRSSQGIHCVTAMTNIFDGLQIIGSSGRTVAVANINGLMRSTKGIMVEWFVTAQTKEDLETAIAITESITNRVLPPNNSQVVKRSNEPKPTQKKKAGRPRKRKTTPEPPQKKKAPLQDDPPVEDQRRYVSYFTQGGFKPTPFCPPSEDEEEEEEVVIPTTCVPPTPKRYLTNWVARGGGLYAVPAVPLH